MNYDIKIDTLINKKVFDRARFVNKGDFGQVAIIGGAKEYLGASYLSYLATTSYKLGAGYVTLIIPQSLFDIYALKNPQVLLKPLKNNQDDELVIDDDFLDVVNSYDALAIGMGLGESKHNYDLIKSLLENYHGKLIVDGTGLALLTKFGKDILLKKKCSVILTPHLKEFADLYGENIADVRKRLVDKILNFAKKYQVILLVKDAYTFASDGTSLYLNKHGNASLAKAGSGDLLVGIILGLIGWINEKLVVTIILASFILGRVAEMYCENNPIISLTYDDVIKLIPKAIKETFSC